LYTFKRFNYLPDLQHSAIRPLDSFSLPTIPFHRLVGFFSCEIPKITGRGLIIFGFICLTFTYSSYAQQIIHSKKLETVKSKNAGFLGKKRKTRKAKSSPTGKEGARFKKWKRDFNPSRYAELGFANYSGRIKGEAL